MGLHTVTENRFSNKRGKKRSPYYEEIYRRFICDVATGHFTSPEEMMEMAKKIKTIIDDRVDSCRWYA